MPSMSICAMDHMTCFDISMWGYNDGCIVSIRCLVVEFRSQECYSPTTNCHCGTSEAAEICQQQACMAIQLQPATKSHHKCLEEEISEDSS